MPIDKETAWTRLEQERTAYEWEAWAGIRHWLETGHYPAF